MITILYKITFLLADLLHDERTATLSHAPARQREDCNRVIRWYYLVRVRSQGTTHPDEQPVPVFCTPHLQEPRSEY